jgi:hypothetical protein
MKIKVGDTADGPEEIPEILEGLDRTEVANQVW